ncbi:Transcriptional regulator, LacI family [Candidatus Burkholderia humilis]|nr:Transcriptional regulator, LacI family [Candidatus Burkholderia humilis]
MLIGAQQRNSYMEARDAYARFCAAHGIAPVIAVADESGGEDAGHDACVSLLSDHPEIDGLCALVDTFAVGAVRAIGQLGAPVPQDIKVVTRYDGQRARACRPPLTVVDLHLDDMVSQAVELLFAHLAAAKGKDGVARSVAPALPELVKRESSGA